MRPLRLVVGAVTMGVAAATFAMPASALADTGSSSTPTCPPLPSYVDGRPAHLHPLAARGDYVWHDSNGWHLRVTHATRQRMVFSGVITASAPITFRPVRDEKRDHISLSADRRTLVFRFVNYGGIDGVDFTNGCADTTRFALALDRHRLGAAHIYIGAGSVQPPHDPFVISRSVASPAA